MGETDAIELLLAQQLEEQRERYRQNLPGKMVQIDKMWEDLDQGGWPGEQIPQLHRLIHNIAGSGGTFGLPQISVSARPLEKRLRIIVKAGETPDRSLRTELRAMFEKLKQTVQEITGSGDVGPVQKRKQVVVSPDLNHVGARLHLGEISPCIYLYGVAAPALYSTLVKLNFEVTMLASEAALRETLATGDGVLVVDIEILARLYPQSTLMPPISKALRLLYTGEVDSFNTRLTALRRQGMGFLPRPIDLFTLVEGLNRLSSLPKGRILLVDDDRAFAEYFRQIVAHPDYEFQTVHGAHGVLGAVVETQPHLILLDMMMPEAGGLEVARLLKQHPGHRHIPLLFLTGSEPTLEQRVKLMAHGADQYLSKDLNPALLQKSLRLWLSRARERSLMGMRDGLTLLPNRQALMESLATEVARARRYGQSLSMALFDIDGFKAINTEHGYGQGDRLLVTLARHLKDGLRPSETLVRYGGGTLGVLLPDTPPPLAATIVHRLRNTLQRESPLPDLNFTLSVGIASHPRYESPTALVEAALGALERAKYSSVKVEIANPTPSKT